MKADLVLVGGGGHCRSCIDVIEAEGTFVIAGIVDANEPVGADVFGYPVLGDDESLPALAAAGHSFLITIGQIRSAAPRIRIFNRLESLGARLATVISPHAVVARRTSVERGTIVMHRAVVNAGARLGANCIINSMALIEHDATVGDHCHVSTGAILNGGATISDRVFVGSGAVILNQVSVAADCVLGAGTVVRNPIAEPGTWAGSPLRRISPE